MKDHNIINSRDNDDRMGDIAQQQDDANVMSLANSIPVFVHRFTSRSRRLIICNDVEGAKRTIRRVDAEHTVDVIFDHPRWSTYWLTIGRRSSICEYCPVVPRKRPLTSNHASTPGFAVGILIVDSVGETSTASIRQLDRFSAESSIVIQNWLRFSSFPCVAWRLSNLKKVSTNR